MFEYINELSMAQKYRYEVLFQSDAMFMLYRYNSCLLVSLSSNRVYEKGKMVSDKLWIATPSPRHAAKPVIPQT